MHFFKRYSQSKKLDILARKEALGTATEEDYARVPAAEAQAIRCDLEIPRIRSAAFQAEAVKSEGEGQEAVARRRFCTSTEKPDRVGDVVRQAGWDFADYDKNPVVLTFHDDREPCGRSSARELGSVDGYKALFQTVEMPLNVPHAAATLAQIDSGIMIGCSVHLKGIEINNPSDPQERSALGLGRYGVEYRRQKMLEWSVCTVPMHQDALLQKSAAIERLEAEGKLDRAQAQGVLKSMRRAAREFAAFEAGRAKSARAVLAALTEEQAEALSGMAERHAELEARIEAHARKTEAALAELSAALQRSGSESAARMEALLAELRTSLKQAPPAAPTASRVTEPAAFFAALLEAADRGVSKGLTHLPA